MDEKKFSLVVLVLIFMVAVPSIIFLFSGSGSTGQSVDELVLAPGGMAYPYQKTFQYGPETGVEVPIYDAQGNLVRYEKRVHTKTGQKKYRPYYEQTYTGERQRGCPPGYHKINQNKARAYESMGREVIYVGDQACWYPYEY